ncbi:MAG: carbohydrate kinase family protein [Acidimicrobiales bacterium]
MTFKAVVSGHICADLYPMLGGDERIIPGAIVDVGPLTILPGGCVANTGRDLHSFGVAVQLVGDVGDDELGSSLIHMLSRSGLDCEGIRRVPGAATSYSLVFEPPAQDRAFWHHVGANSFFDGGRVTPDEADLVHLGYPPLLPAMYAAGGAALQSLLARIRESGATTSLDLSTVAAGSRAAQVDWEGLLARTLPLVDVLSPSVDDVVSALRIQRPESGAATRELARHLVSLGAAVVLLTDGARGMHLVTAGAARLCHAGRCLSERAGDWASRELFLPASIIGNPVTTGAGDAATAGLLYGVLSGVTAYEAGSVAARFAEFKVGGGGKAPFSP